MFGGPTRSPPRSCIPGPQCMPGVVAPGIVATLRLLERIHNSGALLPGNVVARPGLLLFCGCTSWDGRAINVKAAPWRAEDGSPQLIGCTHDGGRALDADAVHSSSVLQHRVQCRIYFRYKVQHFATGSP